MVLYRRHLFAGQTHVFTVALSDRTASTITTHIPALRAAFRQARAERPFTIEAIVILPDHLHALLTLPEGDTNTAHPWRRIKTLFTRSLIHAGEDLPKRDKTGRTLWQTRFWEHTIRNPSDFNSHVTYIHNNPVKHGYVSTPTAWPYSSIHRPTHFQS